MPRWAVRAITHKAMIFPLSQGSKWLQGPKLGGCLWVHFVYLHEPCPLHACHPVLSLSHVVLQGTSLESRGVRVALLAPCC